MHPYQLTFTLSREPICPGCNAKLVPGGWTIRLRLALCVGCAETLGTNVTKRIAHTQAKCGEHDWSVAHEVYFLTPRVMIPRDVCWHIWVIQQQGKAPLFLGQQDTIDPEP